MAIIRILEDQTINQIAAGEVIERPSAALKELMENALDAKATSIEARVDEGGKQRIRVRDDGLGMDAQDAMMCLERHGTSKIRQASDLLQVQTMGFRGEALPSIASVSRFTLTTRQKDSDAGKRIVVEGGVIRSMKTVGCAPGTEVDVRALFYNLPVRRQFLRTTGTELGHCQQVFQRLALAHPKVSFQLNRGSTPLFTFASCTTMLQRAQQVFSQLAPDLHPIDLQVQGWRITGLISPPSLHRPTATRSLFLYVNSRYVRDIVLRRAILDAYRDSLPKGRFPFVILNLHMDPQNVDVNVHPAKIEVRFTDPRGLAHHVSKALREELVSIGATSALPNHRGYSVEAPTLPFASYTPKEPNLSEAPPPAPSAPAPAPAVAAHPDDAPQFLYAAPPQPVVPPQPMAHEPQEPTYEPPPSLRLSSLKPLGEHEGLWVVKGEAGLFALHSSSLAAALAVSTLGPAKALLVPVRVNLPSTNHKLALKHSALLEEFGLSIAEFDASTLLIRRVPRSMGHTTANGLLSVAATALKQPNPERSVKSAWRKMPCPPLLQDIELRTALADAEEHNLPTQSWLAPLRLEELF